jgi:ketosteroid isomerase-like protein
MMESGLEETIAGYHSALSRLIQGDPEPQQAQFSHRDDVTLANPFGPVALGWDEVRTVLDRVALMYVDAGPKQFERLVTHITRDLAFIIEVERARLTLRGHADAVELALRVTTIFRPEDGTWKVVHRHADTVTTPRPPESSIP